MAKYYIYKNLLFKVDMITKVYDPYMDSWNYNYVIEEFHNNIFNAKQINEYQALNIKMQLRRIYINQYSII